MTTPSIANFRGDARYFPLPAEVAGVGSFFMTFHFKGALAALALLCGALPAAAQTVEFTLINDSSLAVHYFYTTPSNESAWGEDLLGADNTLESGSQGTVTIGDGSDQCLYDFRFEMAGGAVAEAAGVDICKLSSYRLHD